MVSNCDSQTQDINDIRWISEHQHETDGEPVWGRLLSVIPGLAPFALRNERYTLGRGDDVDFSFNIPAFVSSAVDMIGALSKIHFQIFRKESSIGTETFLKDCSSNGTFVNGEKVGKNCTRLLPNNAEIALAQKEYIVFVYVEVQPSEDENFPRELTDRFILGRTLGKGACGEVRLAFAKQTCDRYAIKIIRKSRFYSDRTHQPNVEKQAKREIEILRTLKHPCIIRIEDVFDVTEAAYVVLEYIQGGELFNRIVNSPTRKLPENIAKLYFYQMLLAVKHLHDNHITHRDLKPENILLSSESEETLVKITDFGLSKLVESTSMLKTLCGTPNYLAPEIIRTAGMGKYTEAVDLWSLGVVLFVCLGGYPPFSPQYKDLTLHQQILQGRYSFPKTSWNGISADAIDLIKCLLCVDPCKRITAAQALLHPWLQDSTMLTKAHELINVSCDYNLLQSSHEGGKRPCSPLLTETAVTDELMNVDTIRRTRQKRIL